MVAHHLKERDINESINYSHISNPHTESNTWEVRRLEEKSHIENDLSLKSRGISFLIQYNCTTSHPSPCLPYLPTVSFYFMFSSFFLFYSLLLPIVRNQHKLSSLLLSSSKDPPFISHIKWDVGPLMTIKIHVSSNINRFLIQKKRKNNMTFSHWRIC